MVSASSLYIPMVDTLFLISSSGYNASKWLAIKSTIAIIPTRAIDFAFFILSNIILTKRFSLLFSYINRLLLGLTLFISCFLYKKGINDILTYCFINSNTYLWRIPPYFNPQTVPNCLLIGVKPSSTNPIQTFLPILLPEKISSLLSGLFKLKL